MSAKSEFLEMEQGAVRMTKRQRNAVPLTCVEEECSLVGVVIQGGSKKCKQCGGDLYPFEEWAETQPEGPVQQDLYDGVQAQDFIGRATKDLVNIKPPSTTFMAPADIVGCPIAPPCRVLIPYSMYQEWVYLANRLNTEWIAYLVGEAIPEDSDFGPNCWHVREMYFPEQTANRVHVEAKDRSILPGTIGAVHSHVGMPVFFSGTDVDHMNHQIELVVNRKGEILANGRTKLRCGSYHRGPAKIEFIHMDRQKNLEAMLLSQLTKTQPYLVEEGKQVKG